MLAVSTASSFLLSHHRFESRAHMSLLHVTLSFRYTETMSVYGGDLRESTIQEFVAAGGKVCVVATAPLLRRDGVHGCCVSTRRRFCSCRPNNRRCVAVKCIFRRGVHDTGHVRH
jgi:hypothetical protein